MSRKTRTEVLARKRDRYARADKEHKTKIINEVVELFDYHRKSASLVFPKRNFNVGDSTWPSQNTTLALSATEWRKTVAHGATVGLIVK